MRSRFGYTVLLLILVAAPTRAQDPDPHAGHHDEASAFNGREPDERRTDVDLAPLDSFSGRVSLLPTPSLALQVSAGRLESAEQDFAGGPRYDVARITTWAIHQRVAKFQAGYARYAAARDGLQLGLGGSLSIAVVPPSIRPNYGRTGLGLGVFAAVRPATH